MKLLRQFVEQQGAAVAQITAALEGGDAAGAERLAHTLRGVAGNLGANSLQASAGVVETLIREQRPLDAIRRALAETGAALDPLLAALRDALGRSADGGNGTRAPFASAPPDLAQTRASGAQLAKLLAGFDASATAYAQANRDLLRVAFDAAEWTQFKQHMENFAYAEAQARLEHALAKL